MTRHSYQERGYVFGQAMLKLRTSIGLTQAGLAALLGVSRRAVSEWEAGSNYPKAEHFKHFLFFSFLHLHVQLLNMLMRFVDLACEVRKIGMQVDFDARNLPMARIAAHIQEIHPTFFEFCELSGISTYPKMERVEAHRSLGWTGQVQAE